MAHDEPTDQDELDFDLQRHRREIEDLERRFRESRQAADPARRDNRIDDEVRQFFDESQHAFEEVLPTLQQGQNGLGAAPHDEIERGLGAVFDVPAETPPAPPAAPRAAQRSSREPARSPRSRPEPQAAAHTAPSGSGQAASPAGSKLDLRSALERLRRHGVVRDEEPVSGVAGTGTVPRPAPRAAPAPVPRPEPSSVPLPAAPPPMRRQPAQARSAAPAPAPPPSPLPTRTALPLDRPLGDVAFGTVTDTVGYGLPAARPDARESGVPPIKRSRRGVPSPPSPELSPPGDRRAFVPSAPVARRPAAPDVDVDDTPTAAAFDEPDLSPRPFASPPPAPVVRASPGPRYDAGPARRSTVPPAAPRDVPVTPARAATRPPAASAPAALPPLERAPAAEPPRTSPAPSPARTEPPPPTPSPAADSAFDSLLDAVEGLVRETLDSSVSEVVEFARDAEPDLRAAASEGARRRATGEVSPTPESDPLADVRAAARADRRLPPLVHGSSATTEGDLGLGPHADGPAGVGPPAPSAVERPLSSLLSRPTDDDGTEEPEIESAPEPYDWGVRKSAGPKGAWLVDADPALIPGEDTPALAKARRAAAAPVEAAARVDMLADEGSADDDDDGGEEQGGGGIMAATYLKKKVKDLTRRLEPLVRRLRGEGRLDGIDIPFEIDDDDDDGDVCVEDFADRVQSGDLEPLDPMKLVKELRDLGRLRDALIERGLVGGEEL